MIITIGNILNFFVASGLFVFGLIYLIRPSFMNYHSQAVSVKWNEIEQSMQFLILALMKTIGGGFIAGAVSIGLLQFKFYLDKLPWIPLLILAIGLITYMASLYAQILVRKNTSGKPPTLMSIIAIISLIGGYIFNYISLQ
jgi:hypothetical protein